MKRYLFFIVFFLAAFGIWGFAAYQKELSERSVAKIPADVGQPAFNLFQQRERWASRIDEVGARQAYEEFKEEYGLWQFEIQHTGAHMMGELLYEKEGLGGFSVCDSSFAFGCFHSFFGRALSDNGLEVVPQLDKACIERYGFTGTGCQHGIGHGILEYMGRDKLVAALETCNLTTQRHPLHGCSAGVFMEYNNSVIFTSSIPSGYTRPFNEKNPYEPCSTIAPERFRKSCYYEIGLWWKQVLNGDFARAGKLCYNIDSQDYRETCFMGVGNVIASSFEYDVERTLHTCAQIPSMEGEMLCRIGAALRLSGTDTYKANARELCKNIAKEFEEQCLELRDTRSPNKPE